MDVLFPQTLEELLTLRAENPDGKIMAGGTDLLVRLRKTGQRPPVVFCIGQLAEIGEIQLLPAEIRIGAAVTLQALLEHSAIKAWLPALHQAVGVMASPPVRHAATLGGNICTASPAGDTLPPLYALDAAVELLGPDGSRRLSISDFITGPGETAAQAGEILTGVSIPLKPDPVFSVYYKVGRRQAMAIAVASLAARTEIGSAGKIRSIKLAWGSVGPTVVELPEVEKFLAGRELSDENLREAGKMASNGVQPMDDARASAAYRRNLAGNLLLRLNVWARERQEG